MMLESLNAPVSYKTPLKASKDQQMIFLNFKTHNLCQPILTLGLPWTYHNFRTHHNFSSTKVPILITTCCRFWVWNIPYLSVYLLCIYVVFHPYVVSYGLPACTVPWMVFLPWCNLPIYRWTPYAHCECDHCWCAEK